MIVAYVMFPVMLGLSAVAHDLFAVLLSEEWMPTAPYFEVVCLAGLFSPVAVISMNILKARSAGPLIVRLEILKKVVMTVIFAVTIPHSVMAVVWGLVAIAFCEMAINFWATRRFTELSLGRFLRTLLPVALLSAAMWLAVRGVGWLIPDSAVLRLLAGVTVGVVLYVGVSALLRFEAFREVCDIIKKQIVHKA